MSRLKTQSLNNRFVFKNWPNEPAQQTQYTRAAEGAFKSPSSSSLKAIDENGKMIAHLVLTRKNTISKTPKAEEKKDGNKEQERTEEPPEGLNMEFLPNVMEMCQQAEKDRDGIDHFEITHIYVTPSHRRHGVVSLLFKHSVATAAASKVPLFVTSEPQAHKFFFAVGCKDLHVGELDLSKFADEACGYGPFKLWGMRAS